MEETRYTIKEAAKLLGVENHVLRHWEEELCMSIERNELGHRYYSEEDIRVLKNVKSLKSQGFQLKAIKLMMPDMYKDTNYDLDRMIMLRDELNGQATPSVSIDKPAKVIELPAVRNSNLSQEKLERFQEIMNRIIGNAIRENSQEMEQNISDDVSDRIIKQMDYLITRNSESEEERFKRLDETIREFQKARMEAAAADLNTKSRRHLKSNRRKS